MGKVGESLVAALLDDLAAEGRRILQECVDERTYIHRTHNLYDSYGYGVYYKGALRRRGFLSASPVATESRKFYGKDVRGREEIIKFLESEFRPTGKGASLAIVAAMPYAAILEAGGGGLRRKYEVISMSYDKLSAVAGAYGKVRRIG